MYACTRVHVCVCVYLSQERGKGMEGFDSNLVLLVVTQSLESTAACYNNDRAATQTHRQNQRVLKGTHTSRGALNQYVRV